MTSQSSSSDLRASLNVVEVKPGVKFSEQVLRDLLPDVETALFFGKVYNLDVAQISEVLRLTIKTPLAEALLNSGHEHSHDLQDYVIDLIDHVANMDEGDVAFAPVPPKGEILPHVWESLEIEVATSIQQVAAKLESVVARMPGKQGQMVFRSMMQMNKKRPTLGVHAAHISHARVKENLLILDVSGSMTANTIRTIVDDVVALAYTANAHLAIVSNSCIHWDPGAYDTAAVLQRAEYGGTHYEELTELLARDWGTVITVADYDSSIYAKEACAGAGGHIDMLLDVSLVNQPTFLAECVGQLADEIKPILIGSGHYVLS